MDHVYKAKYKMLLINMKPLFGSLQHIKSHKSQYLLQGKSNKRLYITWQLMLYNIATDIVHLGESSMLLTSASRKRARAGTRVVTHSTISTSGYKPTDRK
jgi:hypothetical protein